LWAVQACLGARKPQDFGGRRSRALLSLRYRRRSNWTWIAKLFRGPRPRAYPSMLWPNRTFVNPPRHSSGLGLCPPSRRLLLAAVSRYPALAAALPHRGRSLAFLGEPSLPFGALTGGSLFSRPKERCPRRVTPSSGRPPCFLPFYFCIQRSCGSSGGMRRRQPWTPLPSTSRSLLSAIAPTTRTRWLFSRGAYL
jgi:hypothetical protein